jgi:hypothetical protein
LNANIIGKLAEDERVYIGKNRLEETWNKWKHGTGNTLFWALVH